jgi:hypothetical protein
MFGSLQQPLFLTCRTSFRETRYSEPDALRPMVTSGRDPRSQPGRATRNETVTAPAESAHEPPRGTLAWPSPIPSS